MSFSGTTKKWFAQTYRFLIWTLFLFIIVTLSCNLIIIYSSTKRLFDDPQQVPSTRVAMVLGTSHSLRSGQPNPFFHNRIAAAAELYHLGKVQYILVSGDNRTRHYNEPQQMRRALLQYNLPDSVIYLDYAGLRTLDSVVRSQKIFQQDSILIISQKFHNQRAIFLARSKGIYAIGYNAGGVETGSALKTYIREYFAKVKVFVDILIRKQPRHLGDEITIGQLQ